METIFENTTTKSKDVLERTGACIMRTKLIVHACILSVIAVAFLVFVIVRNLQNVMFFAIAFSMACIALSIYRFTNVPKKYAEKTYSDMYAVHKEAVKLRISVCSQYLQVENEQTNIVHKYGYEDLTKVLTGKKICVLRTNKKTYIPIDLEAFEKGDAETFLSFIKSKTKI